MQFALSTGPSAVDDTASTLVDTPVTTMVLLNDFLGTPPTTITSVSQGSNGSVTFNVGAGTTTYAPSAGFTGTDNYTYTITDSNGETDSATDSVNVSPLVNTLQVRVAADLDDAEERATGDVALTSRDLELTFDKGGNQTVGMRFNGITIPNGATITDAYLQFQVDETTSVATSLTISGEDKDSAIAFTNSFQNISSRPVTSASVPWSPAPWTTVGASGPDQQTPNIAPVIQEIVNRGGWTNGNSLVIIVTGTGERVAESYRGDPDGAPLLFAEYALNSGPIAVDDTAITTLDTPVTTLVLLNDQLGVPPTNITSVTQGSSGAVTLDAVAGTTTYNPNQGFVGTDNYSYAITDDNNDTSTVTVTVTDGNGVILIADFNNGIDGFNYVDDPFRSTNQPTYAMGTYLASGGLDGEGLQVTVGGIDNEDILGMSGGWTSSFSLGAPTQITISFNYNLTQALGHESDELSQALLSVDGVLVGNAPNDYLAQIVGDGNTGGVQTTGWQNFTVDLGTLSAGAHSLVIGGYNNQKTFNDEITDVLIDDVVITWNFPVAAETLNIPRAAKNHLVASDESASMDARLEAIRSDANVFSPQQAIASMAPSSVANRANSDSGQASRQPLTTKLPTREIAAARVDDMIPVHLSINTVDQVFSSRHVRREVDSSDFGSLDVDPIFTSDDAWRLDEL
jgi:hypothetical protein